MNGEKEKQSREKKLQAGLVCCLCCAVHQLRAERGSTALVYALAYSLQEAGREGGLLGPGSYWVLKAAGFYHP